MLPHMRLHNKIKHIVNCFDHRFIISGFFKQKMSNICYFQFLNVCICCFFLIYDNKWCVFGFLDCWLGKRNNLKTSLAHTDWPGKRLSGRRWSSPGSFAWWPSPVRPGRAAHAGTVCRCTWPQATDPRPSAHSTPALPERGDRKRCYFNLHQPFTISETQLE